jgi:hypothetical protein
VYIVAKSLTNGRSSHTGITANLRIVSVSCRWILHYTPRRDSIMGVLRYNDKVNVGANTGGYHHYYSLLHL